MSELRVIGIEMTFRDYEKILFCDETNVTYFFLSLSSEFSSTSLTEEAGDIGMLNFELERKMTTVS